MFSVKFEFTEVDNLLCIKKDIFSKVWGNLLIIDSVWSATIGINRYIIDVKIKKINTYIKATETILFNPNRPKNFCATPIPILMPSSTYRAFIGNKATDNQKLLRYSR